MKTRSILSVAVIIMLLGNTGCARQGNSEAKTAAVEAAMIWLTTVDSGQYGASWDETAEYFKMSIARENWEEMLSSFRGALGKRVKREFKSSTYRTSVPGAPDGEYVIVQFRTSFANKKKAVETVTPMRDPDDQWRVSSYFIK